MELDWGAALEASRLPATGLVSLAGLGLVSLFYFVLAASRGLFGGRSARTADAAQTLTSFSPATIRRVLLGRWDPTCVAATLVSLAEKGVVTLVWENNAWSVERSTGDLARLSVEERAFAQALLAGNEHKLPVAESKSQILAAASALLEHVEPLHGQFWRRNRGEVGFGIALSVLVACLTMFVGLDDDDRGFAWALGVFFSGVGAVWAMGLNWAIWHAPSAWKRHRSKTRTGGDLLATLFLAGNVLLFLSIGPLVIALGVVGGSWQTPVGLVALCLVNLVAARWLYHTRTSQGVRLWHELRRQRSSLRGRLVRGEEGHWAKAFALGLRVPGSPPFVRGRRWGVPEQWALDAALSKFAWSLGTLPEALSRQAAESRAEQEFELVGAWQARPLHPPTRGRIVALALIGLLFAGGEVLLVRETDFVARLRDSGLSAFLSAITLAHFSFIMVPICCVVGILRVFGPRLDVRTSPKRPRPGDTVRVFWQLSRPARGRFQTVTDVTFSLSISESWVSTNVDPEGAANSKTRFHAPMLVTRSASDWSSGEAVVVLPSDPGLCAPSEAEGTLSWRLSANARVRFWPDLAQGYEVKVEA